MKAETIRALNRRLLANFIARSSDLAEQEIQVPASHFTCPERFERERQALFFDTPQPVAFSAELPTPGTTLSLTILGIPVLLTRNAEGQASAFINACTHRGAPLCPNNRQRLVCGFHGWNYSLDGELLGRPQEACFDTPSDQLNLRRLPVSERHGLISIGLRTTMSGDEVAASLSELDDELAELQIEQHVFLERRNQTVDANWKLVNDLSLESYHFNVLHRDSVAAIMTDNAIVDTFGRSSRWAFPLKSISALKDTDEKDWPNSLQGSCTYTLYPCVMLIVNSSGAQMIRAEPGESPQSCQVSYVGVRRPEHDHEEAMASYQFGGDVFEKEDLPMAVECQRGISASQTPLVVGKNEPLLQFWHALWAQFS